MNKVMHKAIPGWWIFLIAIVVAFIIWLTTGRLVGGGFVLLAGIVAGMATRERNKHIKTHPELYTAEEVNKVNSLPPPRAWWKTLLIALAIIIAILFAISYFAIRADESDGAQTSNTSTFIPSSTIANQPITSYVDNNGNVWSVTLIKDTYINLVSQSKMVTITVNSDCSAVMVLNTPNDSETGEVRWGSNNLGWNLTDKTGNTISFPDEKPPFANCPIGG